MKPSLLILPLVAALAVGTASAEYGDGKGPRDGDRAENMAKRLIEKHDENNDGALNEAELTEALKAMHKHRMQHRKPGKGNGQGPEDGSGKKKRRSDNAADNAE